MKNNVMATKNAKAKKMAMLASKDAQNRICVSSPEWQSDPRFQRGKKSFSTKSAVQVSVPKLSQVDKIIMSLSTQGYWVDAQGNMRQDIPAM